MPLESIERKPGPLKGINGLDDEKIMFIDLVAQSWAFKKAVQTSTGYARHA
jgi:hypothetical protein